MNRRADSRRLAREHASAEVEASLWLARQDAGLSDDEAVEMAAWRAAHPQHEAAFQRLAALSGALRRARQTGAIDTIRTGLAERARARRIRRAALGSVAVVLLVLLGVSVRHGPWRPTPDPSLHTGVTRRELPDGSSVELNAGAELAVRFNAGFRRVELLHGEALFHVAKDPQHPFIVRAGEVDVRAVGTAFSVRLGPQQVEVLVTEGKVGLDEAGGGRSLLPRDRGAETLPLGAGKWAVVAAVHPTVAVVTDVTPGDLEHRLAWRSTRIQFEDLELAQAVQQMNARNRLHIALGDETIGRLRISGSFSANDPRTFARLAAATFGLSADEQNGTIVLH